MFISVQRVNHQYVTQLFAINVPMVKHPLRLHQSVCVNVVAEKVRPTYTQPQLEISYPLN